MKGFVKRSKRFFVSVKTIPEFHLIFLWHTLDLVAHGFRTGFAEMNPGIRLENTRICF